ncbi:unnamed protein product [Calicophoron daubneyi]|uniref:Major facilitator superfamily (MFS) profile domain-containing protein n=1 Tax=Calicophoron daubneyi TaxID=300641 RepID=A0AAV2TPC2_CALDB
MHEVADAHLASGVTKKQENEALMRKYRADERKRCIDRKPAWVVAFCACVILGIHYGMNTCGALFYPTLMEATGYPISVVTWLVTGQFAIMFCLAPLYNRIMDLVPLRPAICVTVILTSAAIIGASFVHNYFVFLSLYTVVGGFGLGTSIVRVIAITAEYFDRYRVIALALCSSGVGLGIFTLSKLGALMIDAYSWRIAMIGYALIHLNVIPLFFIVRPLPSEPMPEPTVLIAEQPDLSLSALNIATLKARKRTRTESVTSVLTVRSCQVEFLGANRNSASYDLQATGKALDLHVIIEFVRASLEPDTSKIIIDPVTFLTEPDTQTLGQLEDAAKQYFSSQESTITAVTNVMIPLIFIIEMDHSSAKAPHANINRVGELAGNDLREWLESRPELDNGINDFQNVDIVFPRRFQVAGEMFASLSVAAYERSELRRKIRDLIEQGEQSVKEYTEKLESRGLCVHPNPVMVLIDHGHYIAQHSKLNGQVVGDLPVLAALDDEHKNFAHVCSHSEKFEQPKPRYHNTTDYKDLTESFAVKGKNIISSTGRPELYEASTTLSVPDGRLTRSSYELTWSHRYRIPSYRHLHDNTTSMVSVNRSKDALDLIISKMDNERRVDDGPIKIHGPRKFLLANPLFLGFLISRSLVYITDSIAFAHLTSFAITLNYSPALAANLLSFIGFTSMLARVGTGLVAHFATKMELGVLTAGCLCALGVHAIVMPWFPRYVSLAAFAVSYGILVSPSFAFAPTMAYNIIGPKQYDEAVSYLFQFEAIGYLLGGPIGGIIKEINSDYKDCFLFAGISSLVGAFILATQAVVLACKRRRRKQKTREVNLHNNEKRAPLLESALERCNEQSTDGLDPTGDGQSGVRNSSVTCQ